MTRHQMLVHRTLKFWQLFAVTLSALLISAVLSLPASAIVTPTVNPELEAGKIAIGMREELGDNTAEIEKILRANPNVRVGWPSEYEIGADPEWPDNFYLIDMSNPAASANTRRWNQVYYRDEPAKAEPVFLGRLDDGSFGKGLEQAIWQITRRKAILNLDTIVYPGPTICLFNNGDYACPAYAERRTTFYLAENLVIDITNAADTPKYIYMLAINPANEILWMFISSPDNPVAARQSVSATPPGYPFQFQQPGRYSFFSVASDVPLNEKIFANGNSPNLDPENCQTILERLLCEALTGINDARLPEQPEEIWNIDSGWNTSIATYYALDPPTPIVGGGKKVATGYAPWQAQIFSNLPYTDEQIEKDRRLPPGESKFLWRLTKYQQEHRCGGSLIAPDVVLTAAHCVAKGQFAGNNRVLNDRRVRLGTQRLDQGGEIYAIDSVIVHKGYVPNRAGNLHDIALLKIKPLGRRVPPRTIQLPDAIPNFPNIKPSDIIRVLGWGYTGVVEDGERHEFSQGEPQAYANDLQIGNLSVMSLAECRKIEKYDVVNSRSICADTPPREQATASTGTTFSCRGDSGGPVIREIGRKKVQVGLVAWGIGCGAEVSGAQQNPSVFIDVAQYTGWIKAAKGAFVSGRVEKK